MSKPTPHLVVPYALALKLTSLVLDTVKRNADPCCNAAYSQKSRFGSVAPKYGLGVATNTADADDPLPAVPCPALGDIESAEEAHADPDHVSILSAEGDPALTSDKSLSACVIAP